MNAMHDKVCSSKSQLHARAIPVLLAAQPMQRVGCLHKWWGTFWAARTGVGSAEGCEDLKMILLLVIIWACV